MSGASEQCHGTEQGYGSMKALAARTSMTDGYKLVADWSSGVVAE